MAAAARAGGQKANPLAMPSLLRSLQIGMTEVELHKARPGAERFELLGEPAVKGDDPDPLYTEIIESPFFETVSYLFCERRLCAVTLAAVGEGEAFSHRQAKIAQGAMRKWGDRPERLLSLGANQEREIRQRKRGALLWKEGSFRVLFTFAPVSKAEPGDAALTVMDLDRLPEDLQASFLQSLTAVVPGQDQGLFAPLEIQVVPPLFE
ncbi:MAG TPA: hypothetical protein VH394_00025 [Thermoanaerobaculia bacterium]|nr:hypothetical protein [Thermoanaerobaculia bacterium]